MQVKILIKEQASGKVIFVDKGGMFVFHLFLPGHLPLCLCHDMKKSSLRSFFIIMVGMTGFEPATPSSRTKCTTKLCYIPMHGLFYHLFRKMQEKNQKNEKFSTLHLTVLKTVL